MARRKGWWRTHVVHGDLCRLWKLLPGPIQTQWPKAGLLQQLFQAR
ncbi:MAG: hypothetical protein UY77_C0005G0005 [Candidatus Uhrbacteria bacterium GW2011_GWA2_53_10]|uniref:Uncharacterized protein n=1 Tax=Candidatus Uhrbacteria bacterium GW2011_GWA2_53_10 TaxID=1618980 RepID=A0A0G1XQI8_9BACT|nr:MAG: hypothetical protein UY77_C0005G0005 [Candidatus Uhrbacteria bacterium GW2011_GWA2_53_10]